MKRPFLPLLSLYLLLTLGPIYCAAATIKILSSTRAGDLTDADGDDDLNAFYQGKGFNSSIYSGTITNADLLGVDLLVIMLPDDDFSASEIDAMGACLALGGRILFMGEQVNFGSVQNTRINSALSALGSSMSLGTASVDLGFNDTGAGQILDNPFNAGVNLINYGNVNSISGTPAGHEIFLAKDLSTVWGGYEFIGAGTLILLADVNVINEIESTASYDNHIFFTNLATVPFSGISSTAIFQHIGSTDPTTEGWTFNDGPSVGPVVNDQSSGFDAWSVDDNQNTGDNSGGYAAFPDDQQVADARGYGWTLSTRIRVPELSDTPLGSPGVLYRDGNLSWQLHFGTDAEGDPIVQLFENPGGATYTLEGTGGGYHLYQLVYDPCTFTADLYVDGAEVLSNYSGFAHTEAANMNWGAFSTLDVGQGNYNLVQWGIHYTPIELTIDRDGNDLTLTWDSCWNLQQSDDLSIWNDLPSATSPHDTTIDSATQSFWRLKNP